MPPERPAEVEWPPLRQQQSTARTLPVQLPARLPLLLPAPLPGLPAQLACSTQLHHMPAADARRFASHTQQAELHLALS